MSSPKETLKNSFRWSFFAECICNIVLPIVAIINANLLKPEDIGILAAATLVISFSQDIWVSGMSKTLIQSSEDFERKAPTVFWINFFFGLFISLILFLLGNLISKIFNEDRLELVLKLLSILVFLSSVSSVYISIMQKKMYFKKIFWIKILTVAIPACISIPLAKIGYSYWALVYGLLAGQLAQFFLIIYASEWRPNFIFDKSQFTISFKYGKWVILTNIIGWFYSKIDLLIIGIYFSSHDLGIYSNGGKFSSMIYGIFFTSLIPVIFSLYCKLHNEGEDLKKLHLKIIKMTSIIVMPIGFGVFAISDQIEKVIFNTQWTGLSEVIAYIGLSFGFSWLVSINGELFKAIGKPEVETKVLYTSICFNLVIYLCIVQYQFQLFLQARLVLTFLGMSVNLYFLNKYFKINFLQWLDQCYKSILCSIFMCVLLIFLQKYFAISYISLISIIILGACIYLFFLLVLEYKFIRNDLRKILDFKID